VHFLLAPSCHGVVPAPIRLLRELRHVGLIFMADHWPWCPLVERAALVACGSEPFMTLSTLRMIPDVVHKWSSFRLFDSINSRVPGINSLIWPFHNLR
jgi:hypothetical protein